MSWRNIETDKSAANFGCALGSIVGAGLHDWSGWSLVLVYAASMLALSGWRFWRSLNQAARSA